MVKLRIFAFVIFILFASIAHAQTTVTCSASNVSASDLAYYNAMLSDINAARVAAGLPALANFNAHCQDTMLSMLNTWIDQKKVQESSRVGRQAAKTGLLTAAPAACSYAGLAVGCTRNQVSCYVLTDGANTTCQ